MGLRSGSGVQSTGFDCKEGTVSTGSHEVDLFSDLEGNRETVLLFRALRLKEENEDEKSDSTM